MAELEPADSDSVDERDPLVALLQDLVRSAGPAFVVSLGMHVVVLIVLAFIVIRHERPKSLPTTLSAFNPAGLDRPDKPRRVVPVEIEAPKADVVEIPAGKAKKKTADVKPEGNPDVQISSPTEVNVSGALGGRTFGSAGGTGGGAGGRGALLTAQGGTEKTEQAVSLGLAWLSRLQRADGHWELHQGYPDAGQLRTSTGATALALLTFLGAGHTPQDGPYKEKVGKAIKWLVGVQKKSGPLKGDFYDLDREGDAASFYSHGQATIALLEAYALTRDAELLPAINDGLAFICESQHPRTGGWKYRRQSEGDLSVFGWQIMALQTARMAGLDVPRETLERATQFLDLVQEHNGARYRYEPNELKSFTPAMTAEGLLCRQYLGWPRNHPAMLSGVKYLMEPENLPSWGSGRRNIYHWYYAAQVLHNLQGPEWETWNKELRDELVKNQVKGGGKVGGSWNPMQPAGAIDENAEKGGRLYVTCLCLLTLEVYYRHLPLYRDAP
ncbi:MAG: terpene cyclase/mutase family protein [Planctomycetia bacterium]|nr:terpene cyclase/mutase family protein [Planctomycetia bacterium]